MPEYPDTRESLILQVKDPANRIAWEEFAQMYRPIVYRVARTRGMQEADAQDLAQQVLMAVASAIGRWEKNGENVRFRNWLSRIIRGCDYQVIFPRSARPGRWRIGNVESARPAPTA